MLGLFSSKKKKKRKSKKRKVGLKADGTLKKGYKYAKGGKIVKVSTSKKKR